MRSHAVVNNKSSLEIEPNVAKKWLLHISHYYTTANGQIFKQMLGQLHTWKSYEEVWLCDLHVSE